VEIVSVARDVGRRAYVAVRSCIAEVDPVGTCTGLRGARTNAIFAELNREYLTVVRWDESPERFIRNALAPLPISRVVLDPQTRAALVTIDPASATESTKEEDSDLRLVSELTGWKVALGGVQE